MWRARKNKIKKLRKENGELTENREEMETMVVDYFNTLYTKDETVNPEQVMHLFEPKITAGMNDDLCKPFTDEEIGDALFQIGPLKAPGPDGFTGDKGWLHASGCHFDAWRYQQVISSQFSLHYPSTQESGCIGG